MPRATSPLIKAGLILALLIVSARRVRGTDLPSSSQEITRCLAACRAVVTRRQADDTREAHVAHARHHRHVAFKTVGDPPRVSAA